MMQNNDNAKPTTLPKTFSELNFASKEAYNLLRTNIVFSFPDSENGKVVGISSPCPSEVINENLSLVTAGDIPPNPSELLGSEKMQAVIELFRNHFDYIILDLPPITAVADPLIVTKFIDGVILVIRHKITKRGDIREAIRQLKMTGVRILGFVYNGYRSSGSYGYKKYGKYSKYYYSSDHKEIAAKQEGSKQ